MFAAVTAGRFASHNPGDAVGILFVIPIAMMALEFRWRGGLFMAAASTLAVLVWANVAHESVPVVGYATRTFTFAVVGVGIGALTSRREKSERDAARWFSMSNDLLCTSDLNGYFTDVNESWTRVLGHTRAELLAVPYLSFVHPDDLAATGELAGSLATTPTSVANFENRYRAKDGSWRWLLWSSSSDGKRIYGSVKDVTERKLEESGREALLETMAGLARTDGLTGVANRSTWHVALDEELVRSRRTGKPVSVLLLDLDHFKTVNDSDGHAAGDRLLKASTACWLGALRAVDTLGRIGGDEFAVVLPDCDVKGSRLVAERIRARTPDGSTCSMGLAIWDRVETPDALLHRADEALYRAKREGRDRLGV